MKRFRYLVAFSVVVAGALFGGKSSGALPPVSCTHPTYTLAQICNAQPESIDGTGNNRFRSNLGAANTLFTRLANSNYADRVGAMQPGPSPRAISNRIFNDLGQNIFSENNISQWGWAWGQFIDHDVDHEDENPGESVPMVFDPTDPFEQFTQVGTTEIPFFRTPAAPGVTPRQQINQDTSFIDASMVYGSDNARDAWLRQNGSPDLMLPNGYLPKASAKPGAPTMDFMGQLAGNQSDAIIAGDVRANENIALTGLTTLFVREHNRIADSLPASLGNEVRFQIARKEVIAEIQWITYTQWLPTLGVQLPFYRGYNPFVNPSVSNEFATVAFRAHSMVHGDFDITEPATFNPNTISDPIDQGIVVTPNGDGTFDLAVPLTTAFGNPDLLTKLGLGPSLASLDEHQYKNDEQIDNTMRSTLFEIADNPLTTCAEPAVDPTCFTAISDLGADDIQRGRDHGMPYYNTLRYSVGLPPVRTFTQITGESTSNLPAGLTCATLNSANALTFTSLTDINGATLPLTDQDHAVNGVRATTLAARLKCIYGSVEKIDAFVGMVSEQHIRGTEFGPLQLAIWRKQFTALRDGDRFFFQNSPQLNLLAQQFHLNFKVSLAQVVNADAGTSLSGNVFKAS